MLFVGIENNVSAALGQMPRYILTIWMWFKTEQDFQSLNDPSAQSSDCTWEIDI